MTELQEEEETVQSDFPQLMPLLNSSLFSFLCFIAGYFWHITDLHFDSAYSTKGDIVRSEFKPTAELSGLLICDFVE
jgi:hypothetical protein